MCRIPLHGLERDEAASGPCGILKDNGLRTVSYVRFDKLAALDKKLIQGTLGQAGRSRLQSAKSVFFGVFGF